MKILHVITNPNTGGAAIATRRLHAELCKMGHESVIYSRMGCIYRNREHMVKGFTNTLNRIYQYLDVLPSLLFKSPNRIFHSYNWIPNGIYKQINKMEPDIVNIHWVGAGLLRPEDIVKINAPIVWTLHDLWPFLGAEHLPYNDNRMVNGYLSNNRDYGETGLDINRWIWNRKKNAFNKKQVVYVAPSKWVEEKARKAVLGQNRIITKISNGLDEQIFKPTQPSEYRKKMSISNKEIVLIYVSFNPIEDSNKGYGLLVDSIRLLPKKILKELTVLIVGASQPLRKTTLESLVKVIWLGPIKTETDMVEIYNAGNLTVVPSRNETLSFAIMESLACGVPCVAFRVGGIPDLLDGNEFGFLAKPYNTQEFSEGILHFISGSTLNSRKAHVNKENKIRYVAKKYLKVYEMVESKNTNFRNISKL